MRSRPGSRLRVHVCLILLVLLLSAMPAGSATGYAIHYGSHNRGCGPEGLFDARLVAVPQTDCAYAYHGGYGEVVGCEGATCAVDLWHSGYAWGHREHDVPMETSVRAGPLAPRVVLCAAEGRAETVSCDVDAARVAFHLVGGCVKLDLLTVSRTEEVLVSRAVSDLLVCREGDTLAFNVVGDWAWFGDARYGCEDAAGLLYDWCELRVGGAASVEPACPNDLCEVEAYAWAFGDSVTLGPRAIALTLTGPNDEAVTVCGAADVTRYVVCEGKASSVVPLAAGACADFTALARVALGAPGGVQEIDATFQVCRDAEGAARIVV